MAGVATVAIGVAIGVLVPTAHSPPASVAGADHRAAGRSAIAPDGTRSVGGRLAALPAAEAYLEAAGRIGGSAGTLRTTAPALLPAAPASALPGDGKDLAPLLAAAGAAIDREVAVEVLAGELVDVDAAVSAALAQDGPSDEMPLREPRVGPAQGATWSSEASGDNQEEVVARRLPDKLPALGQRSTRDISWSADRPSIEQPAEAIDPSSQEDSSVGLGDRISAGGVGPALAVRYVSTAAAADVDQAATADAERDAQIQRLLALGEQALRSDRLTLPAETSAHRYFGRVLALDVGNTRAAAGLARIVRRYHHLAEKALHDKAFERAERYIARALLVQADEPGVLRLRTQLEDAIAQARTAGLAAARSTRIAAEQDESHEPEIEFGPGPESNFRRLMRLVD
jgi:hypothetical protein